MGGPLVQLKAVEGDALPADGYFGEIWADLGVKPVPVHAEVTRGGMETQKAGEEHRLTPNFPDLLWLALARPMLSWS